MVSSSSFPSLVFVEVVARRRIVSLAIKVDDKTNGVAGQDPDFISFDKATVFIKLFSNKLSSHAFLSSKNTMKQSRFQFLLCSSSILVYAY